MLVISKKVSNSTIRLNPFSRADCNFDILDFLKWVRILHILTVFLYFKECMAFWEASNCFLTSEIIVLHDCI